MPKKKDLTESELHALILARSTAVQARQIELQEHIQKDLGGKVLEEEPHVTAIKKKVIEYASGIIAQRLIENNPEMPLLMSGDFTPLIPSILEDIERASGETLEGEEREMIEGLVLAMLESVLLAMEAVVPPNTNAYESNRLWLTTVQDLADEHSVPPIEFLKLKGAEDEVTRLLFTEEQFLTLAINGMDKFTDVDTLKKVLIDPILNMLAPNDPEARRELEKEIEEELMPELREIIEKSKKATNVWLGKEVERIYPVK